jgi:glycerophosphoryl diester phosphodiesterase
VGRLAPGVRRALVTEFWDDTVAGLARDCGAGGVCIHRGLATPERLAELAGAGLSVVVWTVDEPAEVRTLLRAGVAAIITNDPRAAVAAKRETGG